MKMLSVLSVCLMLAGGCSRQAPALSVDLVNVHFDKATAFETTATFTLRLNNESPKAMSFTGSSHKIYVNGLHVGSGLDAGSLEVPRLSSVTNAVVMHLNNLALATRVKSVIEAKSIACRIQSVFYGSTWLSRKRALTEGKLDLSDFTTASGSESSPATNSSGPPARQD